MLCGTGDAERRVAQHSAAQHSTCKQHMHDRDTVHAHAHVSCTVVPSCLASTFHRPAALLRGFGAQSPLCTVSVHSSGCGRRRAPPRDSDAHYLHVRNGVCHHLHHSTHTESAPHSGALTRTTHTCYATACVASLAHNPRRYVDE